MINFLTTLPRNTGMGRYTYNLHKMFNRSKIIYINLTGKSFDTDIKVTEIAPPEILRKIFKRKLTNHYIKKFMKSKIIEKLSEYKSNVIWITTHDLLWLGEYLKSKRLIATVHDILPIIPGNIDFFPIRLFHTYREVPFLYRYLFDSAWNFIAYLKFLHLFNIVIVPSDYSKEELKVVAKILDLKLPKVVVLLEPISEHFRPIAIKKPVTLVQKKVILHVGSDMPRKNIITILESLKYLQNDYVFVKIGKLGKRSLEFIKKNKLDNRVIRLGKVSEEELVKWYNIADVFVFPSFYEGFGLPPLEAMACGCPVIVSKRASLPEVCGDAAVYLKDPTDPEELAKKIEEICENKELREDLIKRGFENAKKYKVSNLKRIYYKYLQKYKLL